MGRGMCLHRGAAWDRAGALCQAWQGRAIWLRGAQLGAGPGRGGGVSGRRVGLCRTGVGLRKGRCVGPCRAWACSSAEARHEAALERSMRLHRGAARDRAGALCLDVQGRGMWLQGLQPGAGLGRNGGVMGRTVGCCRTGSGAWAGRGVAQMRSLGPCRGAACSCARAWHSATMEQSLRLR